MNAPCGGGTVRMRRAGIELAYRLANRCTRVWVLDAVLLEPATFRPVATRDESSNRAVVLDERDLLRLAHDASTDLTPEFVTQACRKGDRCHAVLDGDVLASYVWHSSLPTHVTDGLVLRFGAGWSYSYKAFTVPAYRGRRLNARLQAILLGEAASLGMRGLIACIEVDNVPSARSFARMGARRVGTLSAVRAFRRYWVSRTPGCAEYGLELYAGRDAVRSDDATGCASQNR